MKASRVATRVVALVACLVVAGLPDARADRCKNHYILDCPWASLGAEWLPAGPMKSARRHHTATLLHDGTVLVIGDAGSSVERFDPRKGEWESIDPLGMPRDGHAATLLADGRVLVTGGVTNRLAPDLGITASAEIFDPATGRWSEAGTMTMARAGHTATLLADGRVLIAGGYFAQALRPPPSGDSVVYTLPTTRTAEIYDPATDTFTPTTGLVVGRYWHTTTLLLDGTVLVLRGSNEDDLVSTLAVAELYDPRTETWTLLPSSAVGSVFHTATRLPDGKVLVTGGYTGGVGGGQTLAVAELFDPATRSWTRLPQMREARYAHSATLLPYGRVLLVGGEATRSRYPTLQYRIIGTPEVLDVATGSWIDAPALQSPRSGHTATLLLDGRVLVAGGSVIDEQYRMTTFSDAELYVESIWAKRPKGPAAAP